MDIARTSCAQARPNERHVFLLDVKTNPTNFFMMVIIAIHNGATSGQIMNWQIAGCWWQRTRVEGISNVRHVAMIA